MENMQRQHNLNETQNMETMADTDGEKIEELKTKTLQFTN